MMLKRLTLVGFKSFADKTEFDFDRGVTCIVGPNGCGKSNVVDAIKWVLGEQSAKSLRGSQMQDVIFGGSGTRKASGMAQVDLTLDNADQRLPLDTQEVVITRRLFGDGTSEYLVNNHVVRLKDIREMFLDTGVGVDAYSIIEQGRIEVLLQASPIERRSLFDEAAGISKYRTRVKETQRKLERTDQNLLRVNDIVEELQRRLRSVKVQAGRAKSWQEYTRRLKELRSLHVLNEYRQYTGELQERSKELEVWREQSLGVHSRIAVQEADAAECDANIVQLDAKISAIETDLAIVASEVNTQRERIAQTDRRMQESQETLAAARTQALAAKGQRQQLAAQLDEHRRRLEALDREGVEVNARIEAMQAEDRQAAHAIAQAGARLEAGKSQLFELVRQISHLRSEQAQGEDQARSLTAQRGRLADRLADVRGQIEALERRCGQIERDLNTTRAQQETTQAELRDLQARIESLDRRQRDLSAELGQLKETRSGLTSRMQTLEELNRRYEGVVPGVKALLADRDKTIKAGQPSRIIGVLGELVEADLADAPWIESALAGLDQVVVVETQEEVMSRAAWYAGMAGKAQVLPLDAIRADEADSLSLEGEPGFVGWAAQRVRYDERYAGAVRWALGRVGLAETLADAVRLAGQAPRGYRFISRDGQTAEAAGPLTLGQGKAGTGLISRRSELRQIHMELRALDAQIAERQERLQATSAEFEALLGQSDARRDRLAELQKLTLEGESQLRAERQSVTRLSQETQLLQGETALLDEQIRQAAARAAAAAEKSKDLEQQQAGLEEDISRLQEEVERAGAARVAAQERLTEVRVAAGQLAEKRAGVAAAVRQTQADADRAAQEHHKALAVVEMAAQRLLEAERTLLAAQQNLAGACQTKEQLQRAALGLRKQRSDHRAKLERLAETLKTLRGQYETHEAKVREREIQVSQLQLRIETLVQHAAEELQVDLAAAARTAAQAEGIDWPAVEAEIAELRGKIERLGHVNLEAIGEQNELEERLAFLSRQQTDLVDSKRQLEDLIHRLNEESKRRFAEAFEVVRGHFQELFRKLFGGGRADLVLTNPEDILESGVDILARPPGKELQSISLLSGGEKALTSMALVMAVFQSNPSPFTILDEADAALDEANNERFTRLIREFLAHSQFIVITHSKRTMAIADVLYGVTMQEAGVSKRVAVRFTDESAQQRVSNVA